MPGRAALRTIAGPNIPGIPCLTQCSGDPSGAMQPCWPITPPPKRQVSRSNGDIPCTQ
ncbi:hypothetical protein OF001_U40081 [Pseudomonas sp. OF001]|nr:hypothetical protein OF001_U40081 [Pseudomonas sp. OF001]